MDYSNTIIYKIVCKDLDVTETYVGHTTNFMQRKAKHKNSCNSEKDEKYNRKVYKTIRDNGGWVNFEMILIETYECNNRLEATQRERYWYEKLDSTMNTLYPGRTRKEYRADNKEKILKQKKQYRDRKKLEISMH